MVFLFFQSYLQIICWYVDVYELLKDSSFLLVWFCESSCFDFGLSNSSLKWRNTDFFIIETWFFWSYKFTWILLSYMWIYINERKRVVYYKFSWWIYLSRCFDFWVSESRSKCMYHYFFAAETWFCCCYKAIWKIISCMWIYMNYSINLISTILMFWIYLSMCFDFRLNGSSSKLSIIVSFIVGSWFLNLTKLLGN